MFNDATCPKCKRKIGWVGSVTDCPPCPHCGHQIPLEELQADEEEMRAFENLLLERKRKKSFE